MLEEHKTALMLLRGRRIADGCSTSDIRNLPRVNHRDGVTQSGSFDLPEATSSRALSPDITSRELAISPPSAHPDLDNSNLDLEKATDVTSEAERTSEPEGKSSPEVPVMISVATSTDDLRIPEADVDLTDEEEPKKEWNIQENILCREEAEGRSRSVSPYTAEKKSYASVQTSKSEVIYPLDEEVRTRFCQFCLLIKVWLLFTTLTLWWR